MEEQDLSNEILNSASTPVNEYSGNLDEYGLRTKYGEEQWRYEYYQRYKGGFLQDSLHGRGKYCWKLGNNHTIYKGMFYANNLEGYGKFSYNDADVFEGLFNDNIRFGPGVFTYSDGSQDVGMWNGKDLIRLCCTVKPEWIPRIARTPQAKVKLLKFKRLVTVCDGYIDRAKEILERLEANEDVMKQSDKLYNVYIRNPNSHFFNKNLYNTHYFCDKNCYIDVALTPSEEKSLNKQSPTENETEKDNFTENNFTENNFTENNVCACEDQQQIRIAEIKSELEHTEEVLRRIRIEIRKATFIKQFIENTKRKKENIDDSLLYTVEDTINLFDQELEAEEGTETNDMDVEFDLEEEIKNIDYDTACKMLNVAESAEQLLLRKRSDLITKFIYETTIPEEVEDEIKQPSTKKVLITDLLAWNNEDISIDMLKHIFLHRNFEKCISFCIEDLLVGNRLDFRKNGLYEEGCICFLKECSNGNNKIAMDLFQCYDLNPDLCDAKGNTGIIYAAARDRTKMIEALVNVGANLDVFNDESFTPLGMCITRYLAVQNNVTNWENAFLKTTLLDSEEQQEVREWRPHISIASLSSVLHSKIELSSELVQRNVSGMKLEAFSELFGSNLDIIQNNMYDHLQQKLRKLKTVSQQDLQEPYISRFLEEMPQYYILNTDIVKPSAPKTDKKGKKDKKPKNVKNNKKANKKSKHSPIKKDEVNEEISAKPGPTPEEILQANKLNAIYETITVLLRYGANPNSCEVPMPPLILSVFTKNHNIVEELLIHRADPNIATIDEKLTALHVLVSLPACKENVETLRILLIYSADPNVRADICHWLPQKVELLANHQLIEEDEGKTPLHLLAMRYDFPLDIFGIMNEMVPILLQFGAKAKAKYLGHTPLSIAMLRGNIELIQTILKTKLVDPNQKLGEEMGVPLSLYILKRYKNMLLSLQTCQDVIKLLVDFKANPFNIINERGNLIDFMIKEHEVPPSTNVKQDKKGKSKKDNKKGKKGSKKEKADRKPVQEELKTLLYSIAKTTLERHTQGYAVKYLYFFVENEDYYDDISKNMAKFVRPQEAVEIAQLLFYRGEIPINKEINYDVLRDLIKFIIKANKLEDRLSSTDINKMLESFDFKVIPSESGKINLVEPEVEKHSDKYSACFNCYRKKGCQLFICPNCYLVYYCSDECIRSYYKQKDTIHKCGTYFYHQQKEIHEERLLHADHWKHTSADRKRLKKEGWRKCIGAVFEHDIQPNSNRRLHSARRMRKQKTVKINTQNLELQESMLSLKWKREGSGFLGWKEPKKGKRARFKRKSEETKDKKKKSAKGREEDVESIEKRDDQKGEKRKKGRKDGSLSGSGDKLGTKRSKSRGEREGREKNKKDKEKGSKEGREKNKKDKEKDSREGREKNKKDKEKGSREGRGKNKTDKEKGSREGQERNKKGKEKGSREGREKNQKDKEKSSREGREKNKKDKENGSRSSRSPKVHESERSKSRSPDKLREETKDAANREKSKDDKPSPTADQDKKSVLVDRMRGSTSSKQLAKQGIGSLRKLGCYKYSSAVGGLDALGKFGVGYDLNTVGYALMPIGGKILELKRRLPGKYQYFLEKISTYWPDFDLSLLFLPYACFSGGQLYYRFVSEKPIFMETYSQL